MAKFSCAYIEHQKRDTEPAHAAFGSQPSTRSRRHKKPVPEYLENAIPGNPKILWVLKPRDLAAP
jgi:hypothetical protein